MAANLETLEVAIQHHRSGELDQAEHLYHELLRIDPQHADALHLVGVLVHQRNRNKESVDYISRAISVHNNVSLYHCNLGASYRELGEIDQAVECFQNAIHLDPHFAGAHYNLGMALEASGQAEKAVACYREALEYNPNFFAAFNNLGKLYAFKKRLEEAVECFREAAKISPGLAEIHYNLGNALAGCQGQFLHVSSHRVHRYKSETTSG
jgi:tetratricopeptide (TPR) repeat protein